MAAVTQESMPPLRSATALGFSVMRASNSPCRWVPYEFMQLQAESHGQSVGENPFDELARIQSRPTARGVLEDRREQHLVHARRELVALRELPCEIVIPAAGDHKLDFIFLVDRVEVGEVECVRLAGIRAFHIDDLYHLA